jgi:hypothetical protein
MFVTPISTSQMNTVKSNLLHHGRGLKLKSSHLTEAFARSVDFNTQAALRDCLEQADAPKMSEFDEDKFFERLSELSGHSEAELKSSQSHWPRTAFTRGVAVNDLRHSSQLSDRTNELLEDLFEMMAAEGVSYYQIKGSRHAYDPDGLGFGFGSYSSGLSAMRRAFLPPTPDMWDTKSWSGLLAEDVLGDSKFSYHELLEIAVETHSAFSRDLYLQDVIFSAEEGLYVNHDTFEGFARSVLFQRDGQLSNVEAADRDKFEKYSTTMA